MKLCIISFTGQGELLSERVSAAEKTMETEVFTKYRAGREGESGRKNAAVFVETSVAVWAGEQMSRGNALLFIGACGIAVRSIAPYLTDKLHDVPVLVMDEKGRYVIPILSGHVGGANEIAARIAEWTGAQPVITTATDLNGKFAVDLFARRNHLAIENKDGIARVSAKALTGEDVTISIEGNRRPGGCLPAGVRIVPYPPLGYTDVVIASEKRDWNAALLLRPKKYVVGVGCKKGKSKEALEAFLSEKLAEFGITPAQVLAAASIEQKKDEPGILAWCRKEAVLFLTYTAEELQAVEGDFARSSFVAEQVGVDNVCERAAIKACRAYGADAACRLLLHKCAGEGMTAAIAEREWSVNFDEEENIYCRNGAGQGGDDDTGGA